MGVNAACRLSVVCARGDVSTGLQANVDIFHDLGICVRLQFIARRRALGSTTLAADILATATDVEVEPIPLDPANLDLAVVSQ